MTNTDQVALDRYNARYNARDYDTLHLMARTAQPVLDKRMDGLPWETAVTELMNRAIDAALELCGCQHYRGATLRAVMLCAADFDAATLGVLDCWLNRFVR